MTGVQIFIYIAISCAVTVFIRFAAFWLFPKGREVPHFITWLGAQLPRATMAMLVVYCLKDVHFSTVAGWAPALIAVAVTSVLHLWKKQMIFSIVGGTAVYMLLIRLL